MTAQKGIAITGLICALTATLIWSGNFVVARGLTDSIPPVALAWWRWMVAVVAFLPFALRPMLKEWPVIRANLGYLSLTAFLGVTTFNTLIYVASYTSTAMKLSLIAITFPIFVIILSRVFLSERLSLNKFAGIVLVALGVITLVTNGQPQQLLQLSLAEGDLWMLLAAISFAAYSILVKYKPESLTGWSFQLSTFLIGLLMLLPFYLWEMSQSVFSISTINQTTLGSILYVGVMASLAAYIVWGKAITILGPTQASMVYYSLPVFSGIAAWAILGEQIGLLHLVSMALIISGVLIALRQPRQLLRG